MNNLNYYIGRLIPDSVFLKIMFKKHMGKSLNLKNPKTFNEKLQWLKINNRNSLYTMMVDKYEVKKYIANIIGEDYIIPTIGIWNNFDDIDFDDLPEQFVLKCTHDSGGVIICKDKEKFIKEEAKIKIQRCLKTNYYWATREWPYKNVQPRIIAEKYMTDKNGIDLIDYKVMVFNGEAKCSFVCTDRFSKTGLKVTFFDRNWNIMPFERHYPNSSEVINKPKNYELMISLAERIADGIPFLRVDFYEINEKVFIGEITFYPGGGYEEFSPDKYDEVLGSWLDLSFVNRQDWRK